MSGSLNCTRHARTRMQQRGFRQKDISLVLACATQIDEAVYLMRGREVDRMIAILKGVIQQLERLRDTEIVLRNERLVTIWRSRPKDLKRRHRRGRQKGLRD